MRGETMANEVLACLTARNCIRSMSTAASRIDHVVVGEWYMFRLATSRMGAAGKLQTSERAPSTRISDIRASSAAQEAFGRQLSIAATDYMKRLARTCIGKDIIRIKLQRGTGAGATWWSTAIMYQAALTQAESRDIGLMEYYHFIADGSEAAGGAGGAGSGVGGARPSPSSAIASPPAPAAAPAAPAASVVDPRLGRLCLDPIIRLRELTRGKSLLVVDRSDAALLVLLYAELIGTPFQMRDPFRYGLTGEFFPRDAVYMSSIYRYLGEKAGLMTTTARWNFLACFPMIASVGIPPLLMFHHVGREDPVLTLATLVQALPSPIIVRSRSGPALDLVVLKTLLGWMTAREHDQLTTLSEICVETATKWARQSGTGIRGAMPVAGGGSTDSVDLYDVRTAGWANYRMAYYRDLVTSDFEGAIARRCRAYLTGLLCLSEVYGGASLTDSSRIMGLRVTIGDAPLAMDLLACVSTLLASTRYVSLPNAPLEPEMAERSSGMDASGHRRTTVLRQNRLCYYHVPPIGWS